MIDRDYDGDDQGIVDREDLPWQDEDGVVHDPLAGGLTRAEYERGEDEQDIANEGYAMWHFGDDDEVK